jgi:hypothetical protein
MRPHFERLGPVVLIVTALVALRPVQSFAQAAGGQALAPAPQSLVGHYEGSVRGANGEAHLKVDLKFEKEAFAGTIDSGQGSALAITGGKLTDDQLVLNFDTGGQPGTINGTVKEGRIEGTWTLGDYTGPCTLIKTVQATGEASAADRPAAVAATDAAKPAAAASDPISGQWDGVAGTEDFSAPFLLTIKLDGEKVTGEISSEQGVEVISGTWKDETLTLSFQISSMGPATMVGAISEGKLIGTLDIGGQMQLTWGAVRR